MNLPGTVVFGEQDWQDFEDELQSFRFPQMYLFLIKLGNAINK